jgi:acetyl-CoA C-acetyltransferase
MKCEEIVIIDAARTAFGTFRGVLSNVPATVLGTTVVKALLERNKINPAEIDELIMGHVLQAGCGPNPARQVGIHSGIPQEVPAFTVNKLCGTGLKAIILGIQALRCGDAEHEIIIAGGEESMDMAPHVVPNSRDGMRMGDWVLKDVMLHDSLVDAFYNYHSGVTAENVAEQFNVTREDQDIFAVETQRKTKEAMETRRLAEEIVPVEVPQKKKDPIIFDTDEHPKPDTTLEALAKLKPAFKKDGTVTAGNASGINDGAAAVIVTTAKKAEKFGIEPMCRIVAYASAGVDPKIMGTGPAPASKKCLAKANWTVDDLELIESNEAFAAQTIYVNREMGWDTSIVNVNGGAIALGHPVAATGARLTGTLLYEMKRRNVHKGLVTMCIGGGMGIAMAVERY